MRRSYLVILVLLVIASAGFGQKAQNIEGIAKETKSIKYYEQQSKLWKAETVKKSDNTNAWRQLYNANRALLQLSYPDVWINDSAEIYKKLDVIIAQSQKHIGNTFDYYFMKGINTRSKKSIDFLMKAYQSDSDRPEVYGWLLSHYIPLQDAAKMTEFSKKMLEHNEYSNANLHWNYNALQTVEKDGVFISNGDMDCSPKYVLQYGLGVRTDVLVISKWLLADKIDYQKQIFKTLGVGTPPKGKDDFAQFDQYVDYITAYVMQHSKRPVYMGCGTDVKFFERAGISDKMFLVGLAFKYSESSFDNMSEVRRNFGEKYRLEYLLNNFQVHHEEELLAQMNLTYLPGLMKLKSDASGQIETHRAKLYNALIVDIAQKSGRKEEVMSWFEN